jgi:hypothetical protein
MGIGGMWAEIEGIGFSPSMTGDPEGRVPFISEVRMGFVYRTGVSSDDKGGTMPNAMLINGVISVQGDDICCHVIRMYKMTHSHLRRGPTMNWYRCR